MTETLVAGRFRIRRLLGSGGTAAVFSADDGQSGRTVALKLLHPHLAADPAAWDGFFEEVRAAQSIAHPGLADIFDAGVEDGPSPVVWIAMECVAGLTLAEYVRGHGPLPLPAVAALAEGLLSALAAAHDGGVVHRDLTPANVMLDPDTVQPWERTRFLGGVRLLDFGLADIPGRTTIGADALLTARGDGEGVVASIPYASPEQLGGRPITEASDLYQLGATLYFALTGRPPFPGETAATIRGHLSAPPPLPSAHRPEASRAWDRVIAGAMRKSPDDRFTDARAMRAAIRSLSSSTQTPTTMLVPAAGPRADPPAERTGVTRVYRTAVPIVDAASTTVPTWSSRAPLRRWPGWAAAGVGVAVIVGVVALSAAAGSAPSPVPTAAVAPPPAPSASAAPTPSAPPSVAAVLVPELRGLPIGEARLRLEAAGFVVGTVSAQDAADPADTVLAADPTPGEWRAPGSAVSLTVASGRNLVPEVLGLSLVEALGLLSNAGFTGSVVEDGTGAEGTVTAAWPAGGSSAPLGGTVVLTVPVRPTPVPTQTPSPTPSATPHPTPSGSVTP